MEIRLKIILFLTEWQTASLKAFNVVILSMDTERYLKSIRILKAIEYKKQAAVSLIGIKKKEPSQ
jgi:hypothetical protein